MSGGPQHGQRIVMKGVLKLEGPFTAFSSVLLQYMPPLPSQYAKLTGDGAAEMLCCVCTGLFPTTPCCRWPSGLLSTYYPTAADRLLAAWHGWLLG